ncbi:MAG: hypothetical protein KKC05_00825 [Nanoarchaeota archaeon]|nr:hypothetical protein [Nanoarchaeota archaeon]
MELKEILEFIESEDKRIRDHYGYTDEEKRILTRTVKLGEEFGELCEEILSHHSFQRTDKLEKRDQENLAEEFADVIFTSLLLARSLNVDIEKAMERKMEKVKKRKY